VIIEALNISHQTQNVAINITVDSTGAVMWSDMLLCC